MSRRTKEPNVSWRFWASFAWAITQIEAQRGRDAAKDFLYMMYEYGCWNVKPKFDSPDEFDFLEWKTIEPSLKSTIERSKASSKGGKAKAESQRKQKAGEDEEAKAKKTEARRNRKVAKAMDEVYGIGEVSSNEHFPSNHANSKQTQFTGQDRELEHEMQQADEKASGEITGGASNGS